MLVDALAGGTADIHALDALGDQVAGKGFDGLDGDVTVLVIACIECGDHTLILGNVFHDSCLLVYKTKKPIIAESFVCFLSGKLP